MTEQTSVDVCEGWWHPNVKAGQVHHHPERPGRSWSEASHRLCEQVWTKRPAPERALTAERFDPDRHRWLVSGLVGTQHAVAYQTSAAFHAAVETLARMLPVWVDGLAVVAAIEDASLRAAAERLAMPDKLSTPLSDLLREDM